MKTSMIGFSLSTLLATALAVAQSSNATATIYALVVVSGLLGLAANAVTRFAERIVLAWHPSIRKEVPA